jgi:hypothetical protein
LYGCSSGAGLALESAASGLPVERLALYEPPYMVMDTGPKPPPDYQQQLERMIAEDRRGEAVKYFMHDVVGLPSPMVFIMGLMPMMSGLKAVAHTIPYDTALMNGYNIPMQRAASIRAPTLVMDGEKTDVRLRASTAAVAAAIPNARRKSLKGQTHNVAATAIAPLRIQLAQTRSSRRRRSVSARRPILLPVRGRVKGMVRILEWLEKVACLTAFPTAGEFGPARVSCAPREKALALSLRKSGPRARRKLEPQHREPGKTGLSRRGAGRPPAPARSCARRDFPPAKKEAPAGVGRLGDRLAHRLLQRGESALGAPGM